MTQYPMLLAPPSPSTSKCYASLLGGCSEKLTGEHLFTEGTLGKGGSVGTIGMRGIPNGKFVGMASATSKVLCSNHNSQLSVLDDEAIKLSKALDRFHAEKAGQFEHKVNGLLFERWLLKVSLGYLAAGHTKLGRRYPTLPEIAHVLFGKIPFGGVPLGLYTIVGADRYAETTKEVLFRALTAIDPIGQEHFTGSFIALHGVPFLLDFGGPFRAESYLRKPDGSSYLDPYDCSKAYASYHPPFVNIEDERSKQLTIKFQW